LKKKGNNLIVGGNFRNSGTEDQDYVLIVNYLTGQSTQWNANVNSFVHDVAVHGNSIYLGGQFTNVGVKLVGALLAVDINSGQLTSFNPMVSPKINDLELIDSTLYFGGEFTTVFGQNRNNAAAITLPSSTLTNWNPNVTNTVLSIAHKGHRMFIGTGFSFVGGVYKNGLASVNLTDGALDTWDLGFNGPVTKFEIYKDTLFATGQFSMVSGQSKDRFVAINLNNDSVITWDVGLNMANMGGPLSLLEIADNHLYVGGFNLAFDNQTMVKNLGKIDLDSRILDTNWAPNPDRATFSLNLDASKSLYLGGGFRSLLSSGVKRTNVAAVDIKTGIPTDWNPSFLSTSFIRDIAVKDSLIYVGGQFSTVNNQQRVGIAAFNSNTGALTSWQPDISGFIQTIFLEDTSVFLGGGFSVNNYFPPIYHFAVVDARSALIDTTIELKPNRNVEKIFKEDSTMYLSGLFTTINNKSRYTIAKINWNTKEVVTWNTTLNGRVLDFAIHDTAIYLVGNFNSINGETRNHAAAINKNTGSLLEWNPNVNSFSYDIDIYKNKVYIAGNFSSVGGHLIVGLSEIDLASGTPTLWNPNVFYSNAICNLKNSILVGGSFSFLDRQPIAHFGGFSRNGITSLLPILLKFKKTISFKLFPNPANDIITIKTGLNNAMVEIFNLNGQFVKGARLTNEYSTIDISSLKIGIYFVKIGSQTERLIISR
jgi:hypothetical protein